MAKIKSFGVRVFVDGVSVGALTDVSISGVDVTFIDLTTHDSPDEHKEFVSGLLDGGTLELSGKFDADNAGQIALQGGAGDIEPFLVIKSDNSGMSFNAVIGGYSTTNPLDDAVEFSASAKISGATTNTILLDPAGANNEILLSGATKSASIVIAANSTALTVVETTGNAVITSGDKRRMRVVADFGDGVETVDLTYAGEALGKASYNGSIGIEWDGLAWNMVSPDFGFFTSSEDVATPDLVTTWTPETGAVSVTSITPLAASAAQVIAAINAESIGSTASNAPGSDGTGAIAALSTTPQQ